jgi:two-component system, chemotaxis family, chemotaxis protein CheY
MCPPDHLTPTTRSEHLAGASSSLSITGVHVLVVDDLPSMRSVISRLLRDELRQAKISEATDGENALHILESAEANGAPIDFVVTDCNMPHMDGISLLRRIRETPVLHHLPVLMVTGDAKKEVILAAAHAGADGYILKPFNASTLKNKLDRILTKIGLHRSSATLAPA